jgi:hypothetical protein
MKILHDFGKRRGVRTGSGRWGGERGVRAGARAVFAAAALTFWLGIAGTAHGQVVPAGDAGALLITAGATGSGYFLQYGDRKMLGITGFVDADTRSLFGVEFEGRWVEWNQTALVHTETYSMGPRYHRNYGKFQPYAKALLGFGNFNFTDNLAQGRYFLVTAGGGLDYHLKRRIYIRAAEFEYQYWPQFTFGAMSTASVSAGLRIRVF